MVCGRTEGGTRMFRSAPPARGRFAAAVSVSILLHGVVGLAWWASQGRYASAAPTGVNTRVNGPPADELTLVLRDPPAPRPRPLAAAVTQPARRTEPVIPAAGVRSAPKPPDVGAPSQPGTSPAGAESSPKSAGAKSLHGPLLPGQSIVYVLDCSSSMGADGMLGLAVAAIKASMATLGPDVRFQVVAYNSAARPLSTKLLPATPAHFQKAESWLDGLRPEGRSDHVVGIRDGLWFQPAAVLLLTDADDLGEDEARRIAKLIRQPVCLSVVVFGSRRSTAMSPLERIVRDHGGTIRFLGR